MMIQSPPARVAVIGGARTPFAKAGTAFRKHSPLDLSVHAVNGLLSKQQLDPTSVDELAYGIMVFIPGAMESGLGSWLFWVSLGVALAVAWVAAFPVNRWLIVRGTGHAKLYPYHHH